jgi:phosphoribosylanthranilate isomerase
MKIKICGLTCSENFKAIKNYAIDFIGLNFYKKSPRYITIQEALRIKKIKRKDQKIVALFVDEKSDIIDNIISILAPDFLQFHGRETFDFCESFRVAYFKAERIDKKFDVKLMSNLKFLHAYLFDTYSKSYMGGTGEKFNWDLIPKNFKFKFFLAGGLTEKNVAIAIEKVKPWGIDIASGVEKSPGIKDVMRINKLLKEVQSVTW